MRFKNTKDNYGFVAIIFHWASAVFATGLFASGLWMTSLNYYSPWYHTVPPLHKAFGLMFAALILGRLAWKGLTASPEPIGSKLEKKAATVAHAVLYLLLGVLFVSGYVIATSGGKPVSIFGIFEVPALFTAKGAEITAGKIHLFTAWSLTLMVLLHAAAAIKHHFINKDAVLIRMLGQSQRKTGESA